ncbi:MAG: hypothetical protein NVSMB18_16330 [Acetobacteraceae bacterium]
MSDAAAARAAQDAAVDHALLTASGMLDEEYYRSEARLPAWADAVRHYLELGWHWNLKPRFDFDSPFLQPFYDAAGLRAPPLLTWIELGAIRGRLPCTEHEARWFADLIRPSPEFDAAWYAAGLPPGMDPALHYVIVGEALGWRPSPAFDPGFYVDRYPDIPASGQSPLLHFQQNGRREGRRIRSVADRLSYPPLPASDRPTILVLAHEASRTGAPILAWSIAERLAPTYDVVAVLMRGGDLEADFARVASAVVGPMSWDEWHPTEMSRVADRLVEAYSPRFAIANSIETSILIPPLAQRGVPSVALVHEFAAYTRPRSKLADAFHWATDIVFPAEIVAQSAHKFARHLRQRRGLHVMAQGRVDPPGQAKGDPDPIGGLVRPDDATDAFVVLSAGSVQVRKGVDIFLSVAAGVRLLAPELDVRFVWIGDGYDPERDVGYSAYLAEQLDRAGLADTVTMLEPVADLDPAYAAADVFLLCSRLDPQPNVGIDSMVRGLPVVCFEGASGTAEVLGADPATRPLVAPHLDAHAAAEIIVRLARDWAAHQALRGEVQRVGRRAYDMDVYIARVSAMGEAAAATLRSDDRAILMQSGVLDPDLALPPAATAPGLDGVANVVLQQWAIADAGVDQAGNEYFRRPSAGFHPQAYALAHPAACGPGGQHPLAHWLRAGRPAGPWIREVIEPLAAQAASTLRVALHAHFYYPDLAPDLAARLAGNQTRCDLFLTTDTAAKANRLRGAFADHPAAVRVEVVPNRGRDIGPFLGLLPEFAEYDVVGHVHGKRSEATDLAMGERWRDFLWDNLVGGLQPMLDTVAATFADRPEIGLLMAEDPHLVGWDENREQAEALMARMGLPGPLDQFFDFPLGTMFWARPAGLRPLLSLDLTAADFPPEPVPYDGTILHALERIVPFVVRGAGLAVAGVRAPGTTW